MESPIALVFYNVQSALLYFVYNMVSSLWVLSSIISQNSFLKKKSSRIILFVVDLQRWPSLRPLVLILSTKVIWHDKQQRKRTIEQEA